MAVPDAAASAAPNISDDEWNFAASYLTLMDEKAPQRKHNLRELSNGAISIRLRSRQKVRNTLFYEQSFVKSSDKLSN